MVTAVLAEPSAVLGPASIMAQAFWCLTHGAGDVILDALLGDGRADWAMNENYLLRCVCVCVCSCVRMCVCVGVCVCVRVRVRVPLRA